MDIAVELSCDGVAPSGPVSAWPKDRHDVLIQSLGKPTKHTTTVKASAGKMAAGLLKTAGQALMHGKVSEEIRNERYETCKACPFFVEDSKRCSECGCFMEAKTWVGGEPNTLCPKQKWSR